MLTRSFSTWTSSSLWSTSCSSSSIYLFVTSVGLVFSQDVPHVADKKDLSAPLATEPQAPSRRLTVLLREKVGLRPRTQKRYPLLKGY